MSPGDFVVPPLAAEAMPVQCHVGKGEASVFFRFNPAPTAMTRAIAEAVTRGVPLIVTVCTRDGVPTE